MLKWLLQGKWFGQALHPYLVHLPIGLYILSLILDLLSLIVNDGNPLVRGAFYAMVVATLAAIVAVPSGLADWLDIRSDHPAKQVGIYHMVLNLLLLGIYGVNIAVRWNDVSYELQSRGLWVGISLLGMGVLAISGYLGGIMVYDDGIGVGRHRRRGKTPQQTLVPDRSRARDGMVPLVPVDQLQELQSLRVDVNGVIMVITRVDGQLHAFQEFCTHRFGPLSEGCFRDGQVICPWHRSCFDMKTGQVTEGPAKEQIRTFRIEVRDGQVWVELPQPLQVTVTPR